MVIFNKKFKNELKKLSLWYVINILQAIKGIMGFDKSNCKSKNKTEILLSIYRRIFLENTINVFKNY